MSNTSTETISAPPICNMRPATDTLNEFTEVTFTKVVCSELEEFTAELLDELSTDAEELLDSAPATRSRVMLYSLPFRTKVSTMLPGWK